jgi:predicted amidohydrolase YtcJ
MPLISWAKNSAGVFSPHILASVRTLLINGSVWTSFGKLSEALLIEDDRVLALGADALSISTDQTIDLAGAFVMPAFADGHAHPLFAGREAQGPKVNGLQSVAEIVSEVKKFAAASPNSKWIIGGAYEAAVVERGDFDAHWLDEAVSDRPVVLHAVDHHTIWVNSKALEVAGITSMTKDPVGGAIARRDDGSPKGTLREPAAIDLITKLAPERTLLDELNAVAWASEQNLSAGVTCSMDAWVEDGMSEIYIEAAKTGHLKVDMNLTFLAQPEKWRSRVDYYNQMRAQVEALPAGAGLTARAVKFICDGALSAGTAAILEPYFDDPTSRGLLIWSDAEIIEAAITFDRQGLQLHIHAIGDAAVRQALDAIEAVISRNPSWDRRPVITHAQLIDPIDLPRFAALGVIANFQPLWTYLDPMNKELILPRLGEARNNQQYQLRKVIDSGAQVSFGSDWPITDFTPLVALAVPVHRQSPDKQPPQGWSIEQAISIEEAMHFYTAAVAHQLFREADYGTLEVGKVADFIILDRNPTTTNPHEVRNIRVLAIYRKGNKVLLS